MEAKTIDQRAETATQCVRNLKLDIPCLLDDMDNTTSEAYAGYPDRLYIVGVDGSIAFAGDKGPKGFKPELVREWLERTFPAELPQQP